MTQTTDMRPKFWETIPLEDLNRTEWEALCDGCGKCCLRKLEDADTGRVYFTNVACRLLDDQSCRCGQYALRKQFVPDCVNLSYENVEQVAYWLPQTCAYRLRFEDQKLDDWHPLNSGDPESVHTAGISMRGQTIPEYEVTEEGLEDHIIEGKL